MAQLLGNVAVGTIVKLKENGSPVDYIVVQQGKPSSLYDNSCNGTWLLRKDIYANQPWNSSGNNTFTSATINTTYLPSLLALYDTNIQSEIKTVKIPYCVGGGSSTINRGTNGFSCQLFLLSGYEVGFSTSDNRYLPNDGANLSYFLDETGFSAKQKRAATLNGVASSWWLRSTSTANTTGVSSVGYTGNYAAWDASDSYGVRPAMIMPSNLLALEDGSIFVVDIPTLTVPLLSYVTQPFTVSWTSVDFADSYTLQRNINNSTWETVYTGLNLSYQDTISSGSSVQYRVCATALGQTGDYSNPKTVSLHQTSPIPTLTMPGTVDLFTTYTISWGAVANADGYIVQKQVNDGDWTQVYKGSGTSFQDSTFYLSTKYRIASTISAGDGYQSPWSQEYQLSINMSGTPIQMTINQDGSYNELYPTTLIGNILGMDKYGYSQQQILSDTTKGVLGLEDNAIPDQAFSVLQSAISSGAKIETGSYVGTGKYGQNNKNGLTFGFVPKLVFISADGAPFGYGMVYAIVMLVNGRTSFQIMRNGTKGGTNKLTWGKTVSWYCSDVDEARYGPQSQLNASSTTYRFIALA